MTSRLRSLWLRVAALILCAVSLAVVGFGLSGTERTPAETDGAMVAEWMRTSFALARVERVSPLVASRASAYAAVAMYEGIVLGSDSLVSLVGQLNGLDSLPRPDGDERLDWATVAVTAHARVLAAMYPDASAATEGRIAGMLEAHRRARREAGVSVGVAGASERYAEQLARAVVQWAAGDGFAETRGLAFTAGAGDDVWTPTSSEEEFVSHSLNGATDVVYLANPTASLKAGATGDRSMVMNRPKLNRNSASAPVNPTRALEPYWGRHRPFVLDSGAECAPPPPAPYSNDAESPFFRQVRAVYDASRALTSEQRETALFWADNPGQTGTPAGHWLGIIAGVIDEDGLSAERAAELFALGSIGIADAFIGCWSAKYQWMLPRPITIIQRAVDPEWDTAVSTPPFPEYPSGHSVQSSAAAEILTALLGDRPFVDATQTSIGHPPRTFASFQAAATEAGLSRLYAGIHFPMAIENGAAQGRCIGRQVLRQVRTRRSA